MEDVGIETRSTDFGALVADFRRAAENGRATRPDGHPYSRDDLRELSAALTHVESELGGTDVRAVRARRLDGLVDELREAGLSEHRLNAIGEALRALLGYAAGQGILPAGQMEPAPSPVEPTPSPVQEPPASLEQERPTPTYAVLSLATHAVSWTVRLIVIAFAVVAVALVVELV